MDQTRLPSSVSAAIIDKCGSIVSLSLVWEATSRKLLAASIAEADVVFLVAGMRSARNLESFVGGIVAEGRSVGDFLEGLRGLANGSDFAIAEWFTSIEVVQSRLARDGRVASSSSILGFVQCSAEFGAGVNRGEGLAGIVLDMLNQYGFEGQAGCATGSDG